MPQSYTGLAGGYGSAFVRLYYQNNEVSANIDDFKYEYFEEGDDVCKISLIFEDVNTPDLPQWQEKTELKVIWGFIGDENVLRKIYIQQIEWEFCKEGIKVDLECTEKAVSLKYQDSQEVHKDISLLGLAKKFADRHDLKAMLEMDSSPTLKILDTNKNPEPLSEYLVRNRKAISDWQQKIINSAPGLKDGGKSKSIEITDELVKAAGSGDINNLTDFIVKYQNKNTSTQAERDKARGIPFEQGFSEFMQRMGNAPQANKTDAQFLSEMAMKAPGGPWIVDTRDDELIIKKRNYNQTPYKSYTFGGDEGSLITFKPISKTRGRLPRSMNVGYQNWDPALKSIITGNANPENQGDETNLSEYVQVYKFYKNLEDAGLGSKRIGDLTPTTASSLNRFNVIARSDNTVNVTNSPLLKLQDVSTRVDALKKAIDDQVNAMYNNTFNPSAVNAVDAYNQANNLRKSNEMKLNPATGSFYGDPNLVVGILITIMGVSKKYSGNYYVIKASHSISKTSGYKVDLEMATQGTNIKATPNHRRHRGAVNHKIGPGHGETNTKQLPIKQNPK